jgi:putative FmdB family regulatory protein
MPIYEYACTACGERTEARQGFDDSPLEECPRCGGKLRKLYSPVGIVFKGSGFYATDGRRSAKPSEDSKEPASKSAKSDSSESSKPSSSSGSGKGSSTKDSSSKGSDPQKES